jgi:hypothetical protein
MNRKLSEICARYELDYWVWTPADFDLRDAAKRAATLAEHEKFYRDCPRLDAIFFPGGDPGDNPPQLVMPFLEDLSHLLAKHHPRAKIWLSMQSFENYQSGWTIRYITDLQKPVRFYLRGEEYSAQIDAFVEAVEKTKVDNSFWEAASTRARIARQKYNNGLLTFEDWDVIENDLIDVGEGESLRAVKGVAGVEPQPGRHTCCPTWPPGGDPRIRPPGERGDRPPARPRRAPRR